MNGLHRSALTLAVVSASMGVAQQARADNGMYPNFGMDYSAVLQNDFSRVDGSNPGGPRDTNDFYPDVTTSFYLRFTQNDQLRLTTEFNPINPPNQGDKRFFEDVGMVVNELNYYGLRSRASWMIGKFEVPFGRAKDQAPGLYTNDFVGAYDMQGMLGATFGYRMFGQKFGLIEPDISLYTADTTDLGKPFFQGGSRLKRSDGGPANSGNLDSYALALNWTGIPALPFLEVQGGYMRNRKGVAQDDGTTPDDEVVKVVSARYMFARPPAINLDNTLAGRYWDIVPFIEYADIDNEDAVAGNDTRYLTTSLTFDYGPWAFGATRTDKRRPAIVDAGRHDYLNELSVTYNVTGRLSVGFSAGTQKQAGQKSDLIGLQMTYNGAY
ncbi:MAG TPA: hypothetical protein VGD42_09625 [Lysobacter sp.]